MERYPPKSLEEEVWSTLKAAAESGAISEEEAGERYRVWKAYYALGEKAVSTEVDSGQLTFLQNE